MDILDNDVIMPLATLKVSDEPFWEGGNHSTDNSIIQKDTEVQTRKRLQEDLKISAAKYADHTENTIMKLQRAYLNKLHPRQYAHSTDASQRPEDVPYTGRRFSSRISDLFRGRQEDLQGVELAKPEEGIVSITLMGSNLVC